jgi:hypothetical protein
MKNQENQENQAQTAVKKINLLSKVTFDKVCGKPETVTKMVTGEDGKEVEKQFVIERVYMRLAGFVDLCQPVDSTFGQSIRFVGQFRAVNLVTGNQFDSDKAFLPKIAESFVFSAFTQASANPDFSALEFVVDIGLKPCGNAHGYEYTVAPYIERPAADRFTELFGNVEKLALAHEKIEKNDSHKAVDNKAQAAENKG